MTHRLKEIFPGTRELPHVYLKPGELFVAWEPTIITTLLGSCVSVVIYVPHIRATAVSHCTLPHYGKAGRECVFTFVDTAIDYMIDTLRVRSVPVSRVKIKIFGGGDVIGRTQPLPHGQRTVGRQNIDAAMETLARNGLTPEVCKVGGTRGYKIFIRSDTGQVRMRYLSNSLNGSIEL